MAQFDLRHDRQRATQIVQDWLDAGKTHIGELEGIELLKCYGFNVLPNALAKTEDEAAAIAKETGFPVVLKIVSAQILHKSDAGGVVLGLKNQEDVKRAFGDIIRRAAEYNPEAELDGVLVQKMAPAGSEVILGLNRYPIFGPLLMVGIGGIFVEVFQDVVFRLAPIGRNEARRMIRQIKGYRLFQGFRGRPPADIEIIEKSMVSLSNLATNHPEIVELDINPLLVHNRGEGATAADCRIILKKSSD
jgi:acetyltransferase